MILLEMEKTYMAELNQNKVISDKAAYISALQQCLTIEWDLLLRRLS